LFPISCFGRSVGKVNKCHRQFRECVGYHHNTETSNGYTKTNFPKVAHRTKRFTQLGYLRLTPPVVLRDSILIVHSIHRCNVADRNLMLTANTIPMHHLTMILWMCLILNSILTLTQILYFAFGNIVITEHRLQLQMRQFILCGDFHAVSQVFHHHSMGVNPLSSNCLNILKDNVTILVKHQHPEVMISILIC